jgi:hypothetical protein
MPATPGDFDKVLVTVANSLIIGNNLNVPDAVHRHVLLAPPLESLAVDNEILVTMALRPGKRSTSSSLGLPRSSFECGTVFTQLQNRSKELKALTTPRIADSLFNAYGIPWLIDLTNASPRLAIHDLNQVAELQLGAILRKMRGMTECFS